MIARMRGVLRQRNKDSVLIDVQNIWYEIFVPKTVEERLDGARDAEGQVEFIVYHYLQTDQARSIPVLIGFLNAEEKDFFELFITVSGIGPKAALRALEKPISQIATAINEGNIKFLQTLAGIGQQRARQIVAQLQGKMVRFGLMNDGTGQSSVPEQEIHGELKEEVLEVLKRLQYKRSEALAMIERALKEHPGLTTVESVLSIIYTQKKHGAI